MVNLWNSYQDGYLSLSAHWWELQDLWTPKERSAPWEGIILPPDYIVALLQSQVMDADHTGKNIAMIHAGLREWVSMGTLSMAT